MTLHGKTDSPDRLWDICIIGGGPAGCTAAIYGAQAGYSVILIEKTAVGGQMTLTTDIDNWPGLAEPTDGFTLAGKMEQHAVRAGAMVRYGTVTGCRLTGEIKAVWLDGNVSGGNPAKEIRAKNVILAAGASPKRMGLPGEEALIGRGISFCAACDARLFRDREAAVVGGGNTAAHDAEVLSLLCRRVTLIHRREQFRMDPARLRALQEKDNVTVMTPYTVSGYCSAAGPMLRLTGIELTHRDSGRKTLLKCDGVFLAVGYTPETAFTGDTVEKTDSGAIVTGEYCRTSLPGVYAIGDCRDMPLSQIVTACADGALAIRGIQADV